MKKSDLVNGSVIETRHGKKYLYVDGTLFDLKDLGSYCDIDDYDENLIDAGDPCFDIMKVHNNPVNNVGTIIYSLHEVIRNNKWTWIRAEKPELLKESINILKALPKKFKYIAKNDDGENDLHVFTAHPYLITSEDEDIASDEYWQYWHLLNGTASSLSLFRHLFEKLDPNICYKISDLIGDNNE